MRTAIASMGSAPCICIASLIQTCASLPSFSNASCNEIVYEDDGEGGGSHRDIQAMANADLISAAPELYAALVDALIIARRNEGGQYVQRAEAALAKARGEAP